MRLKRYLTFDQIFFTENKENGRAGVTTNIYRRLSTIVIGLVTLLTIPFVTCEAALGQPRETLEQQLLKAVPGPDDGYYLGPYLKWPAGSRISVVVMTDDQSSPCVAAAIADIRREWALIRRDVPALANSPDLTVTEQLPPLTDGPVILLGLPTEGRHLERALKQMARERRARLLEINRSFAAIHSYLYFDAMTVIGHRNERIQFAYHRAENKLGIAAFENEGCDRNLWADSLYDALGTYNLVLEFGESLLAPYFEPADRSLYPRASGFYRRLFLQALYSSPGDVEVDQLRSTYHRLLVEAAPTIREQIVQ